MSAPSLVSAGENRLRRIVGVLEQTEGEGENWDGTEEVVQEPSINNATR